jgi:hypothetical protein
MDQKAAIDDPVMIHAYSHDLIEEVVRDPDGNGKLIDSLSDRLAKAEQAVREGKGKLVPERDVVRAFNELMRRTGELFRADEANVHGYRIHASELRILPSLLTADRNGTNCNPGEAVFLVAELISNNGKLSQHELDLVAQYDQGRVVGTQLLTMTAGVSDQRVGAANYRHRRRTASKLFNNFAQTLRF